MKCRTCARRLDLERLDYTKGCKHEQMEGFVCLACAFEGVAYWMTNISEDDYCEEYVEKQVKGELISREDAIDALNEYFARIGKLKRRGLTKGEKAISLDTVGTIKTLPSAEPKTGKWIEESDNHGHSSYFCSRCGTQEGEPSGFCPNCGADMRGECDENR